MCDHCSLRKDLPGFISADHVNGNIEAIKSGDIFKCHMIHDPHNHEVPNRTCLGAALVAGVPLVNAPAGGNPEVYEDLEAYRQAQVAGRKTNSWLGMYGDIWVSRDSRVWYGWWELAPAGNWHYLMTTVEDNDNDSVYLFFEQCQELFGPLRKRMY